MVIPLEYHDDRTGRILTEGIQDPPRSDGAKKPQALARNTSSS